jgi:mannose-6-phosphate isomerase-like protein (cupin superfamily)
MNDYRNVVVNKPWGYEYLMYQNDSMALWCLFLKSEAQTSLHCHPKKKTGLILLQGDARVSFLNDWIDLKPLAKLMIREGLFHSTRSESPDGTVLIEAETPCDKENLVRLSDEYGRREMPYEGKDSMMPIPEDLLRLDDPTETERSYSLCGCSLSVERIGSESRLEERPSTDIVVILEGGLVSQEGEQVLGPADVVSFDTLSRLSQSFGAPRGTSILSIRK